MCEPMHGLGRRGARSGSFLLSAAFLHVVGTWSIFFLVRVHNGVCVPKLCSQVVRSFVVRFAYCLWRPRRTRRRREKGRATPGGMASAVPPRAATSAHARTELACQTQRLPSAAALRPAQETAPLRRADDDQASARPPQGRIANPVPARLHSYAGAPLATFARHGAVCLCALGSPARRA